MKSKLVSVLLVAAVQPLFGQIYSSCDQWAFVTTNGYNVSNDVWGSGASSQCLTVFAYNNWYVDTNQPNTSGVKSYPHVEKVTDLFVNTMGTCTSSFSVTRPSIGAYSSPYDIWYDNNAYEVMLWMNKTGAIQPIARGYDASGNAIAEATNVSVGGHTWNVYKGSNGANQVFSFIRTSNTNSGTVDITAISKWIQARGWFGNAHLQSIQFGFEITSSGGSSQRYSCTGFGVTIGSGGGATTYNKFQNRATGLYIDGMGRTGNGSTCGQYAGGTSTNQQWVVEAAGSFVKLKNRTTNLYIDGAGQTANGSAATQWASSTSNNQQWTQEAAGSYFKYRNRTTGLYLDGMGRTANGSDLGQWASSTSNNQQFSKQ